jgi:hypothetical protein
MPQIVSSVLSRIGKALHAQHDDTAREPLPERWVDLIKYLDEKERAQRGAEQPETRPPPKRQRST